MKADYGTRTVAVRFDPARVTLDRILAAIAADGFTAAPKGAGDPGAARGTSGTAVPEGSTGARPPPGPSAEPPATAVAPAPTVQESVPGFAAGLDVAIVVLDGARVELAAILVPGKFTVVDFYADWCVPCRALDAQFARLLSRRSDLAVRKLNIVNWDSPLSQQHLADVDGIPFCVLFGPDGRKIGAFTGTSAASEIAAALP